MIQANSTLEFSVETSFQPLSCPGLNVAIFAKGAYTALVYIGSQLINLLSSKTSEGILNSHFVSRVKTTLRV